MRIHYSFPQHAEFRKSRIFALRSPRKLIESADFPRLSRTAPALAGDLAYLRFCTPRLSERRTNNHGVLTARARFHLRGAEWSWLNTPDGKIRTFTFNAAKERHRGTVLVVHGWTSEASFMAFHCSEEIAGACPSAKLVAYDYLGHNKILSAPPAIRAVLSFIAN